MLTYDDYVKKFDDSLDDEEFDTLHLTSVELIQSYTESFISQFRLEDCFERYGINIDESLMYQINFLHSIGGLAALQGQSDLLLESVSTSGFNYRYKGGNQIYYFHGIPLSPVAQMKIKRELRRKGYLKRGIYA